MSRMSLLRTAAHRLFQNNVPELEINCRDPNKGINMKWVINLQVLMVSLLILVSAGAFAANRVAAQDDNPPATADDQTVSPVDELIARSKALSTTTTRDGKGWEEYQNFLHKEFSRWSTNTEVLDRDQTVAMIRQWWEGGNRQSKSEEEVISVQVVGTTGVLRKKIHEMYIDGDGNDAGEFRGHVTQTWVNDSNTWQLLSVTIQVDP